MSHRWTGLGLLCVASFMVILDAQIVTIAVPAIQRELGFSAGGAVSAVFMAAGYVLWTQVPADGTYVADLLPGLVVFGPFLGAGCVAGAIAAVAGVTEDRSGLASGLNNASFQIGGALGIAIVSTVSVSSDTLIDGFRAGFVVAIGFPVLALTAAVLLLGPVSRRTEAPRQPAYETV